MTLFEYLAIAFSLVLSFSAMRVLAGLSFAATTDRRYWVHLVFVCVQLLVTVLAFWNLWGLRETTWTLPKFVLSLTAPGLIYFNTCTLIPEQASGIDSWRDYYYSVRRRYFIGIAAQTFVVFLIAVVIVGRSVLNPGLAPAAVGMAAGLLGATSSSERVHAGLALGFSLILIVSGATIFLEPGSIAW